MNNSPLEILQKSRIIVVGTVRNVQHSINSEIENLLHALRSCKELSFYIVESDSTDLTIGNLQELARTLKNFQFLTLGQLEKAIPSRIERIAHCRNAYLEYVKNNSQHFDYVVVVDLDGVNKLISEAKLLSCFEKSDWGCCAANQIGPYYDIFALRSKGWCESDCWKDARQLVASGMHPLKAWRVSIRDKQKVIEPTNTWIKVDSAFGGFAIYRIEAFIEGRYSTVTENESGVCEHISLNLNIVSRGWSIYINPALTNFDYNEHNDFSRLSRRIKYIMKYCISALFPVYFIRFFMPELQKVETAAK